MVLFIGNGCIGGSHCCEFVFFFQAEDGIRGAQESRELGDVYKRQEPRLPHRCRVSYRVICRVIGQYRPDLTRFAPLDGSDQ